MWKCPICFGEKKKNNKCLKCGFDERTDYIGWRTICEVSIQNIEAREALRKRIVIPKKNIGWKRKRWAKRKLCIKQ